MDVEHPQADKTKQQAYKEKHNWWQESNEEVVSINNFKLQTTEFRWKKKLSANGEIYN